MPNFSAATLYHTYNNGVSMTVRQNGANIYTHNGGFVQKLASGTKSFWGVLAQIAIANGLFSIDTLVADTIPEWTGRAGYEDIKVHHLLDFTSGLEPQADEFRGNAYLKDTFDMVANTVPMISAPGAVYRYGPSHLTAFGLFVMLTLEASGDSITDPVLYLQREFFDKINITPDSWTRDKVNNPTMPYGAGFASSDWVKFGQFVLDGGLAPNGDRLCSEASLQSCFVGTAPSLGSYGLTFWLNDVIASGGLVYSAKGSAGQRQYIIPSYNLVIARTADNGNDATWDDNFFISLVINALDESPGDYFELLSGGSVALSGGNLDPIDDAIADYAEPLLNGSFVVSGSELNLLGDSVYTPLSHEQPEEFYVVQDVAANMLVVKR